MKRTLFAINLVALSVSAVVAAEDIATITVESTRLSDVSGEEVKSADLAEALAKQIPSVSLVRRSGIANDIILRGQKKDNINILIDDAKVYGACPNRMDPPTSHILTNNIKSIEIIEGPFDVENFGSLSGSVKITTKEPTKELKGEINVNVGSWDYLKTAATMSGGNDSVRFLLSASKESSSQYEDGDGNDFYDQIAALGLTGMAARVQYKDIYKDLDAYDKKTLMGKLFIDVAENQQLNLSVTANRSDDILYPSSKMDALYDDSNIYNVDYIIKNLGEYSKSLDVQVYHSDVEHPMSTFYRDSSSSVVGADDSNNEVISKLTTDMDGIKIKNSFDVNASTEMTVGVDSSNRNWDGEYIGYGANAGITGNISIDDVDTANNALFTELETKSDKTSVKIGARLDNTSIDTADSSLVDNNYTGLSANVFAKYQATDHVSYFGGVGQTTRVPDARELYFRNQMGHLIGTPTLEDTRNFEVDLGVETKYDSVTLKTKVFYSWLKDYIYYNADKAAVAAPVRNAFENINATIYGLELSGNYFVSDAIYVDFGIAYLRGEKDEALAGQTDKDLAEITPLKGNIALNYEYGSNNIASIEVVAADAWDNYDADNGEQALPGYGVTNLKVTHNVSHDFEVTVGVDNLFDKTYAVSNTYNDLTLLVDGTGDVMLMNEPGRYYYVNATYKF